LFSRRAVTSPSSLPFSSTGMFSWVVTSGRKFPGCFRFQRATQPSYSLTQTRSKEEDQQRRSKLKVHVLWSSDWFRRPGFSTYPICDRGCLVEHAPGDELRARILRVCVQAIHVCFLGYPNMLNCHRDFLVEQALGPFHDTGFFA